MRDLMALEMVGKRFCCASCLLAHPDEPCTCSLCKGAWHGSMGLWKVPGTAKLRRPKPAPQPGPDLLDLLREEVGAGRT